MSNVEPNLSEFPTKKELAAELRRNPRTLDRWQVLGIGPPRTRVGRQVHFSAGERGEMACCARTKMGRGRQHAQTGQSAGPDTGKK